MGGGIHVELVDLKVREEKEEPESSYSKNSKDYFDPSEVSHVSQRIDKRHYSEWEEVVDINV